MVFLKLDANSFFPSCRPLTILLSMLGILAAFALLIGPFAKGWLGGGDVKLLMVCGAFLAWQGLLSIVLWSVVLNGLVSLAWVIRRKWGRASNEVPFAVSVAAAVFVVLTNAIPVSFPWQ